MALDLQTGSALQEQDGDALLLQDDGAASGVISSPLKGTITTIGAAPTFIAGANQTFYPATGTLAATGYAPSLPLSISVGTVVFTGLVPSAVTPETIPSQTGALAFTGLVPIVSILSGAGASPGNGTLTLAGFSPTVLTPIRVQPQVGTATLAGYAPLAYEQVLIPTQAGSVTFTGLAPDLPMSIGIPVGASSFVGYAPTAFESVYAYPTAGTLTFTGLAPQFKQNVYLAPSAGTLTLSGQVPTAVATDLKLVTPAAGGLTVTGLEPEVISEAPTILKQPDAIAVVEGDAAVFTMEAEGQGTLTYQWYETTAGLLPGKTSPQLVITPTRLAQSSNGYYAIVSNGYNSTQTSTATLTVAANPGIAAGGGGTPVVLMLSGGVGNYLPANSIGGPASKGVEGLVTSQVALASGTDTLPQVLVLGAYGMAEGQGSLQWDHSTSEIKFTDSAIQESRVPIVGTGLYWTGANPGSLLLWVRGALPNTTLSVGYAISAWQQNLFDDLDFSERASAHTNYRCMYVQNTTAFTLSELSIRVSSSPAYGEVAIATEYPDSVVNAANALYVEQNAIQRGGTFILGARAEAGATDYKDFTHRGGPFLQPAYEPILASQSSDGSLVEIASTLVDEYDSTNVLSGLSWGDTIAWADLPAGKYVSFWVRRYLSPGASGSAVELDNFTVDVRYKRST